MLALRVLRAMPSLLPLLISHMRCWRCCDHMRYVLLALALLRAMLAVLFAAMSTHHPQALYSPPPTHTTPLLLQVLRGAHWPHRRLPQLLHTTPSSQ